MKTMLSLASAAFTFVAIALSFTLPTWAETWLGIGCLVSLWFTYPLTIEEVVTPKSWRTP